jgi:hypothetical protein
MEEQPADSPLRLDAPREEALARAAKLIEQAWRSFDRFRPEEPPLDERVRALLRSDLPEEPSPVFEVLDDVARILDEHDDSDPTQRVTVREGVHPRLEEDATRHDPLGFL